MIWIFLNWKLSKNKQHPTAQTQRGYATLKFNFSRPSGNRSSVGKKNYSPSSSRCGILPVETILLILLLGLVAEWVVGNSPTDQPKWGWFLSTVQNPESNLFILGSLAKTDRDPSLFVVSPKCCVYSLFIEIYFPLCKCWLSCPSLETHEIGAGGCLNICECGSRSVGFFPLQQEWKVNEKFVNKVWAWLRACVHSQLGIKKKTADREVFVKYWHRHSRALRQQCDTVGQLMDGPVGFDLKLNDGGCYLER